MTDNVRVDTCGLSCPQPMLMVKKALEEQGSGKVLVLANSTASYENISRIAAHLGWEKASQTDTDGVYTMEFVKGT